MPSIPKPFSANVSSVVLAYSIFAGLWILLSDQAIALLFTDPAALVQVSMLKGWFFVAITSLLLYVLVKHFVGQLAASLQRELMLERQRQQAPTMLSAIADNTDDAIFATDEDGRYLMFNNAAAHFVGKPIEAVLGQDDRALFPPEQAEMLMDIGRRVMATGQIETNEEIVDTPAGRRVFLATKGPLRDADGKFFGIFGISRDITERKRIEEALHEREHRLNAIVSNSPSALTLKHPDGRYALANPNMQRIHHMTEAEIVGKTDFDLYPEMTAQTFRNNDRLVLESMARHSIEEIVPVDGVPRTYMSHMFPVLDNAGKVEFICRISLDITESKKADEALQASEQRFVATFEQAAVGIAHVSSDGRWLRVNRKLCEIVGYSPDELLTKTFQDNTHPDDLELDLEQVRRMLAKEITTYSLDKRFIHKDGNLIWIQLTVALVLQADGSPGYFISVLKDITERVMAETELRQRNAELEHFNRAAIERELRMVALKREVNDMARAAGHPAPYDSSFADTP